MDTFGLERQTQRLAHVPVLVRDDVVGVLDHRDLAAEAPEHLAELESDVAAANHQQVFGHLVEIHHGAVGEVGDRRDAVDGHHQRAGAGVDDDGVAAEPFAADLDGVGIHEVPFAAEQGDVGAAADVVLLARAPAHHDVVLELPDLRHVDPDIGSVNAVAGSVAGGVGHLGAGQHSLGGGAAVVHTGAAEMLALD